MTTVDPWKRPLAGLPVFVTGGLPAPSEGLEPVPCRADRGLSGFGPLARLLEGRFDPPASLLRDSPVDRWLLDVPAPQPHAPLTLLRPGEVVVVRGLQGADDTVKAMLLTWIRRGGALLLHGDEVPTWLAQVLTGLGGGAIVAGPVVGEQQHLPADLVQLALLAAPRQGLVSLAAWRAALGGVEPTWGAARLEALRAEGWAIHDAGEGEVCLEEVALVGILERLLPSTLALAGVSEAVRVVDPNWALALGLWEQLPAGQDGDPVVAVNLSMYAEDPVQALEGLDLEVLAPEVRLVALVLCRRHKEALALAGTLDGRAKLLGARLILFDLSLPRPLLLALLDQADEELASEPRWDGLRWETRARLALRAGDPQEAAQAFGQALPGFHGAGQFRLLARAICGLARVLDPDTEAGDLLGWLEAAVRVNRDDRVGLGWCAAAHAALLDRENADEALAAGVRRTGLELAAMEADATVAYSL